MSNSYYHHNPKYSPADAQERFAAFSELMDSDPHFTGITYLPIASNIKYSIPFIKDLTM